MCVEQTLIIPKSQVKQEIWKLITVPEHHFAFHSKKQMRLRRADMMGKTSRYIIIEASVINYLVDWEKIKLTEPNEL